MIENLQETFEKFGSEFGKFNKVKNPPCKRSDICAFLHLDKLVPGEECILACAEFDEITLSIDLEVLSKAASEDDILYLIRCGVSFDEEYDSLRMFV